MIARKRVGRAVIERMALFAGTIDFPANQKLVPRFMRNRDDRRANCIVKNEVLDQLRKNQIAFGAGHKQRIHNSWRENRLASGRRTPNGPALYSLS